MKVIRLLAIAITIISTNIEAQECDMFNWNEFTEIPSSCDSCKQFGVSAPFGGESNGAIIVAGGCNFPDKPVVDGGTKRFYDDIYILPKGKDTWLTGYKLPTPAAYGASATTPKGVVFIGGSNSTGSLSEAIIVSWDSTTMELTITPLPSLPYTITEFSATAIGNTIYVAGGKSGGEDKNQLLSLNLKSIGNDSFTWEVVSSFAGDERFQSSLVSINSNNGNELLLVGGYQFYSNCDTKPSIANTALIYNIDNGTWREIAIPYNNENIQYTLTGATYFKISENSIAFIGGVDRTIFQDALNREHKNICQTTPIEQTIFKTWRCNYLTKQPKEYKFNSDILIYNPTTNIWHIYNKAYPYPAPAGAIALGSNPTYYIINGETKPGIRTPKVYRCTLVE